MQPPFTSPQRRRWAAPSGSSAMGTRSCSTLRVVGSICWSMIGNLPVERLKPVPARRRPAEATSDSMWTTSSKPTKGATSTFSSTHLKTLPSDRFDRRQPEEQIDTNNRPSVSSSNMDEGWTTLADGLCFPEAPRWYADRLWFSDQHGGTIWNLDQSGQLDKVIEVPNHPSGLGWTPAGDLMVVSMIDRRLLLKEGDRLVEICDFSDMAPWHCNEMVVDAVGRADVGNFGFDHFREEPRSTVLLVVEPGGRVSVGADDLLFPNGMTFIDSGSTLVVAETYGQRLTGFDVAPNGALSGRRVFASLPGCYPDGICADAEDAIWVASPLNQDVLRVDRTGEVVTKLSTGVRLPIACALGGPQGNTLFVCTAPAIGVITKTCGCTT